MTKAKTKTETTGEKKSATPKLNNEFLTPLETKKSKTKSKTKTKTKKPNIQITRTINISSLVTDCVYDVENRIQSYADNNDIQFSKDEITKIMKAIKEQLK
jgi:hypothetical protein